MINKIGKTERVFLIGSEWLYFKIYMGSATTESTLTDILAPMASKLADNQVIDKWFFINYNDPNRHIRIRFHLTDSTKNIGNLLSAFNSALSPLLKNYSVNDIQTSTYHRELERYGNEKVEEFESLFYLNSNLVIDLWKLIQGDENRRWLITLKCIDRFINDWGLSTKEKIEFCTLMEVSYSTEMRSSTLVNQNLAKKYRNYRPMINEIFEDNDSELTHSLDVHEIQSSQFIKSITVNCGLEDRNDFLSSYIHMFCNRVFLNKQRHNEWVLYYFLSKHYISMEARNKFSKNENI